MSAAVRTRNEKMLKAVSGEFKLKRIDVIGRSFVDVVRPVLAVDYQSVAPIQFPTVTQFQ